MNLALLLARRFRRNRRSDRYLSFISWSSSIGIGLGTAVMIVLLSVMNGFERALEENLLAVVPHAEFEAVQGGLSDWQKVAEIAATHPNVLATAPNVRFTGLVQRQQKFHGVQIRAVQPDLEQQVSGLQDYVSPNAWALFTENEKGILLGKGLAEEMDVEAGDTIRIMVPELSGESGLGVPSRAPKQLSAEVVGIFEFGGEIDYRSAN